MKFARRQSTPGQAEEEQSPATSEPVAESPGVGVEADRTGEWSSVDLTQEILVQPDLDDTPVGRVSKLPAVALAALGSVGLFGVGATVVRGRVERSLVARSESALAEAGVDAIVTYSGRDATVKVPNGLDPDRVAQLIRTKGASPDAPHYSGPRAVKVVVDKALAPVVTTTVVPVEPGAVTATLGDDGTITISGAVESAEALAALKQGVAQQSPAITVKVEAETRAGGVDARTATWLARSIGELARVGASEASVVADSSGLTLSGAVPTLAIRDAVNAFVRTSGLPVTGQLAIVRVADSSSSGPTGELFGDAPIAATSAQAQIDAVLAENNIQFRPDSAKVTADGEAVIKNLAAVLKTQPSIKVTVTGHTDSNGSAERNLTLSVARADAVREELVKLGISEDRITTLGEGDSKPLVSNDTPANRRRNRRIEVTVSANE